MWCETRTKKLLFKINMQKKRIKRQRDDEKVGTEHILEGLESWVKMCGMCMF